MTEKKDTKFVEGVFVDEKEFDWGTIIKFDISDLDKFISWCKANSNTYTNKNGEEKKSVKIDIMESRNGKKYAKLNDFKPNKDYVPNTEEDEMF